jgi:uncharacterized protein YheU (UPF0270 family)
VHDWVSHLEQPREVHELRHCQRRDAQPAARRLSQLLEPLPGSIVLLSSMPRGAAVSETENETVTEPGFVLVPADALSPSALEALVQEFVTREGTDYGPREYSLEEKVQGVRRQLDRGEVVIAFDLEQESATLVLRTKLPPGTVTG